MQPDLGGEDLSKVKLPKLVIVEHLLNRRFARYGQEASVVQVGDSRVQLCLQDGLDLA